MAEVPHENPETENEAGWDYKYARLVPRVIPELLQMERVDPTTSDEVGPFIDTATGVTIAD
jgi:hypothetical protein